MGTPIDIEQQMVVGREMGVGEMKEKIMGKKLLAPAQVIRVEELLETKDEWGRCKYSQEQIADIVMCSPSTVGRIARRSAAYAAGNVQVQMARGERMLDTLPADPVLDKAAEDFTASVLRRIEAEKAAGGTEKTIEVANPALAAKLIELGAQHVKPPPSPPPSPMDGGDAPDETEGSGFNKLLTTKGDEDGRK